MTHAQLFFSFELPRALPTPLLPRKKRGVVYDKIFECEACWFVWPALDKEACKRCESERVREVRDYRHEDQCHE